MIASENIAIRTVRRQDLPLLYALSQDFSNAGEFMPVSLVSESEFYDTFDQNGFWQDSCGRLVIEDNQHNIVGEIGSFKTAHYMNGREVYYRIFAGHRQKGYAKKALCLFTQFFFESTHFNRLQAVTVCENVVSSAMLKKQGFVYEGTLRQGRWFKGNLVDLEMYSLLREEWKRTDSKR